MLIHTVSKGCLPWGDGSWKPLMSAKMLHRISHMADPGMIHDLAQVINYDYINANFYLSVQICADFFTKCTLKYKFKNHINFSCNTNE